MKLWAGRFSKEADKKTNDFNSSIATDSRMYAQDIDGSIAHVTMLAAKGIIPQDDAAAIAAELVQIKADIADGDLLIDPNAEDIHTFIEQTLTERIGDAGKRLHTGRSRNDQVALDVRLYLRDECDQTLDLIKQLIKALSEKGEEYPDAIMPGYTHLQRAQPITFKAHLAAYIEMLTRDLGRVEDAKKRMNSSPLGSGALAGTTYPIDRAMTASLLGFDSYTKSTLDGVADRDFCIELASALSICMVHLSRLCEEIILWCSWEFKFVELDDAFSTGSSIMPQKKNPDIAELVRGKSGRVIGDLMTLLTVMKGLPLAYNKDMQEDKDAIFDAFDTVKICLVTLVPMIETMKAIPENMRKAAAGGFINATDCADYLVSKGLPFRDAYKATGELVALCIREGKTLETLTIDEYKSVCELFDNGVYEAINLENCVRRRGM
ncbi:MAG: argininosuccinate lyase [Clostridia bacterium]|nr:argininosuccinate lyase [Clostridia bacterium]MBQ2694227.1 argininosuccinate lyase [Clostridia bacterium]